MSSAALVLASINSEAIFSHNHFHTQPGLFSNESILIYLAFSGSMVPMRVMGSDSIEAVKLRIQNCGGFVVKKQKLVCGGRELARSDSLVRDYGVSDGNVFHLVVKLSDLQIINVRTAYGEEFTFHVERSRDVGYVKQQVAKKGKGLVDVEDQEIVCDGKRVEDQRLIDDICEHSDAVLHLLVRKSAKISCRPVRKNFKLSVVTAELNEKKDYDGVDGEHGCVSKDIVLRKPHNKDVWLEPIIVNRKVELSPVMRSLINSTSNGLDAGNYPLRSSEGTGGVYLMPNVSGNRYISVFKPMDEEPMAVNNPRGLPISTNGEGLKGGTRVGEGAFREVAAYILDHPRSGHRSFSSNEMGFAGVPPTTMVKCLHKAFNHTGDVMVKIGSLQSFMENSGSCEDIGPAGFPVEEVHKITVLDIRLANADRHAGNILMSKDDDGRTLLIPIDHGYCLPESFEDCTFEWLYWPQARVPYSAATIRYIQSLDAEEDIALLQFHGWDLPLECARILRISTMLLKKGAELGLTPFTIGSVMCRETLNTKSMIEEIVLEAQASMLPDFSEASFLESVSQIMDRRLSEISE